MSEITRGVIVRVGVDLAKRVIQVHAVDANGRLVTARALARDKFMAWCAQLPPGCLVAMEACSGAHHWARKLLALGLDARLISASFVTPYRMEGRGGKNDANDAAAVCEAASRPKMRFVPVKSVEQQGVMTVHRLREGIKEERTACINRIRGLLAEFGLVFAQSPKDVLALLEVALAAQVDQAGHAFSRIDRVKQYALEAGRQFHRFDHARRGQAVAGADVVAIGDHVVACDRVGHAEQFGGLEPPPGMMYGLRPLARNWSASWVIAPFMSVSFGTADTLAP